MVDDDEDMFLDTKLKLKLKMATSCREQNNFTLTLKILKETHSVCLVELKHMYSYSFVIIPYSAGSKSD